MQPEKGEYMEMEITDTIQNIHEREWNALAGTDRIERSRGWYRTIEDSGVRKMNYVFLKESNTLTAAACCHTFIENMYNIKIPFLEVRTPLGKSSAFFSENSEQTAMLLKGLEDIQKKEKTKGFLILDFKQKEFNAIKKYMKGFIVFQLEENTYMDLDYSDFDDYLSTLSRKARGNIRNTLNKAEKRWNIKKVVTNEFSKWGHVAHRLQNYICERHNDYRWFLKEEFYPSLETHLKDKAEMLLFFKDDIPLASGLSLNSSTICECRAAGIDPHYRQYQAYFLMYYEVIKRAIERGQKRIYFGTTTYEVKEKLGSKREELFGFAKMENPLLDTGLKSFLTISRLWNKKI